MADRATILARVREALRHPSRRPAGRGHNGSLPVLAPASHDARPWLPPVGREWADWADAFATASVGLRTDFSVISSPDAAVEMLRRAAEAEGWTRVATHADPLVASVVARLGLPTLNVSGGYDVAALESCSAGVTGCDALIGQTGSVLVTARSTGGRAVSVYPPHHVVIAPADRLVPDLPAAFDRLAATYGADYPSLISFITGPSRTGDIERVIVLGAHGPKRLTVLLLDR